MKRRANLRQGRHRERPQQAPIVGTHAPLVFSQADVDQFGNVDIIADRLRAGHGKIIVLYAASHVARDADALPDQEQPDGQHFEFEEWPPPKRHDSCDAMPPN